MMSAQEFVKIENDLYLKTLRRRPGQYRRLHPGMYYVQHHGRVYVVTDLELEGGRMWTWYRHGKSTGNDVFFTYAEAKAALESWILAGNR